MTKITTDFVGTENIAVTKQRLTDILAYWGASTAAYTTWGQARTALNALLTSTTAGTIGSTELAGSFLPKVNFLNDPDEMIADALFGAGEQGVWLDPSDVANVAWRYNLILQAEAFESSSWGRVSCSITETSAVDPLGGNTARRFVAAGTSGWYIQSSNTTLAALGPCTFSMWVKRAGATDQTFKLFLSGANQTSPAVTATATWQRVSYSVTVTQLSQTGGLWPNGAAVDILIWGAQLELGTVATDYQRISDLNTEVIERFPDATMYQDAAGTVPVYAPGQPVGLRLDKSKGLVTAATPIDGNFNTATWTKGTGWSSPSARSIVCDGSQGAASDVSASYTKLGVTVKWTFNITAISGTLLVFPSSGSAGTYTTTGVKTIFSDATTTSFNIFRINGAGQTCTITDIRIEVVAGNHATQSTLGSRPTYGIEPAGGRRNLLTQTEGFDDASWLKGGITVAANNATAPNGAASADTLTSTASPFALYVSLTGTAARYTASAYFKAGTDTAPTLFLATIGNGAGGAATFNLTAATATAVNYGATTGTTATITSVGSGWYRCTLSVTLTAATYYYQVSLSSTALTLAIWGAQLELGSTATAYQKVTTAFDVTEAGVNSCHYCQYDGSDDGMVTNSIDFTATDKMSVFAGVWKRVDAARAIFAEFGSTSALNGSFTVDAPTASGAATYRFGAKGVAGLEGTATGFAAPIANVIQMSTNLVGATPSTQVSARINGTAVSLSFAGGTGGGSFGNYPLYIGRRNNATDPFSGRDYGIIVTGKLANATAIATTEMWLANKTAGVTL